MTTSRFVSRFSDRGAAAEKAAQKYLDEWESGTANREYERLVDTKAAGRIIKAAAADFAFYCPRGFGLIEVKETKHDFRLDRSRITQMARLRKRAKAGGVCLVLILHSTIGKWRCRSAEDLFDGVVGGSWDLRDQPAFDTPREALRNASGIFQ